MKKYFLIIPFIVFFFIVAVFFYLLTRDRNPSELPSVLLDKKVPIFETSMLLEKKNFISQDEFNDEIIVVNFFATWCVPCRAEHKYIKRLSNKGIKIIGINYKDDPKQAILWLEELGNPYSNVAIDSNGSIAIDWGVYGIPESFIVNAKNVIQHRHVGPITKKEYNDFYYKILEIKE